LRLGISSSRLILQLHSLRAVPAGAASKPLCPFPKICKILFGGL